MKFVLYNSLTSAKEQFIPFNNNNVTMYACGPTVYDRIHIGNARSAVIYDLLYRVLQFVYGRKCVKYVQNITDIDDKIIARAQEIGINEKELTNSMIKHFISDLEYLNCLKPTIQPKATDEIDNIIQLIRQLIDNKHAYVANGNVLFDVTSHANYGELSKRNIQNNVAGARITTEEYKKHPMDFLLWKETNIGITWDSPWGKGRPGWHIECSAMSVKYLGENFDIHGGGVDLKFPHHENEIAQSKCAHKGSVFAKYWVHNGFLMVNGEKMSKSLGNFITVSDIIKQGVQGGVLRLALLSADYKKPLNFSQKLLDDSQKTYTNFLKLTSTIDNVNDQSEGDANQQLLTPLLDDLNTPKFIARLHELYKAKDATSLLFGMKLIGLL